MNFCRRALAAALVLAAAGADWPGLLGPHRDGVSPETGLLTRWPEGGPRLPGLAAPRRRTSCWLPDHSDVHSNVPVRDRMARTARR